MSDTQTEARAIAAVRDWLNGGCSSWGLPSQQIETLLTALAAKDAELAELREAKAAPAVAYWRSKCQRAEAQLAEARKALDQRDADIAEFMGRLGPRWFLEQGWFPESMEASDDL